MYIPLYGDTLYSAPIKKSLDACFDLARPQKRNFESFLVNVYKMWGLNFFIRYKKSLKTAQ